MNENIQGLYAYHGKLELSFINDAIKAYHDYKAEKEPLMQRIRDNEKFYRDGYTRLSGLLKKAPMINTPLVFSSIENACATASENFPDINILEREPDGSDAADLLSKLIPVELDYCDFKGIYKNNFRTKCKFGTSVYGIFYNEAADNVDIRSIDIQNIYCDMHVPDVQDSRFLFITAAVDNAYLKEVYPEYKALFTGDASMEHYIENYQLSNRTEVIDCYYKKPDGTLHMMKLCRNTVISATEDMEGYEHGLYDHGLYPVVFDVCFPVENTPFGFGFIDIGKSTQIQIDKLDKAITKNIMVNAVPRTFVKKQSGVDERAFNDLEVSMIKYEGDGSGIIPIQLSQINQYYVNYREIKKDELKELLANRDFQQGATSGGVTAASAIETLAQAGEKRSRSMIDDSYNAFKQVITQFIELIRQFYNDKRTFRTTSDTGKKTFLDFSNEMMAKADIQPDGSYRYEPIIFDVDIIPQRENQFTRETLNNTIVTLWGQQLFNPQNYDTAMIVLKAMSFDGKEQLISAPNQTAESGTGNDLVGIDLNSMTGGV